MGEDNWQLGSGIYTLLIPSIKLVTNEDLLIAQRILLSVPW